MQNGLRRYRLTSGTSNDYRKVIVKIWLSQDYNQFDRSLFYLKRRFGRVSPIPCQTLMIKKQCIGITISKSQTYRHYYEHSGAHTRL